MVIEIREKESNNEKIGQKMIYLNHLMLSLFSLPIDIVARFIAPILPIFATNQSGWCGNHSYIGIEPRLPRWLGVFQTPDNSLFGDQTFQEINGRSYWSQVKWLARNPAYSYGIRYLTPPYEANWSGDKTIRDNDNARAGWCFVRANGLFQFTWVKQIGYSRCIYCNFGWNIRELVDDGVNPKPVPYQATFVFSPRLSGFR